MTDRTKELEKIFKEFDKDCESLKKMISKVVTERYVKIQKRFLKKVNKLKEKKDESR